MLYLALPYLLLFCLSLPCFSCLCLTFRRMRFPFHCYSGFGVSWGLWGALGAVFGRSCALSGGVGVLRRYPVCLIAPTGLDFGSLDGARGARDVDFGGPEPRFSSRFSIVLPCEFIFDFSTNFRGSLQPTPCRLWIGETSLNPVFVRPVEVFQGFFDIAHP